MGGGVQFERRLARLEATSSSGIDVSRGVSGLLEAASHRDDFVDFGNTREDLKGIGRWLLQAILWYHPHRDAILMLPPEERSQALATMCAAYEQTEEWDISLVSWGSHLPVDQGRADSDRDACSMSN